MRKFVRSVFLPRLLPLTIFLAAVVWAATKIDWHSIGQHMVSASPPEQAAMALCWLAALFIRPIRLLVLVKAAAPAVERRYWPVWSGDMLGMATNSLIPMRAGELVMVVVLRRFFDLDVARATSIVIVDRFFDLIPVVIISVSTLLVAPIITTWAGDIAVTLVTVLALMAGGLWLVVRTQKIWIGPLERLIDAAMPKTATHFKASIHGLIAGLSTMGNGAVLSRALLCSIVLWTSIVLSFWFGIRAVWPGVPITAAAFAASAVSLSFIMPLVPGGVGVFHGAVVLALSLYGIPVEPALAFAVVAHALQMGSALIFATVAAICQGISVKSLAAAWEAKL